MKLHQLPSIKSRMASRKGRGIAAGQGKTAGRGTKGQKSRSGYNIPRRFEGGQSALLQRLPKIRGVKSHVYKPVAISYKTLEWHFADGTNITKELLWTHKFIPRVDRAVKIIGSIQRTKSFTFDTDITFSKLLKESLTNTAPPKKVVKADPSPALDPESTN